MIQREYRKSLVSAISARIQRRNLVGKMGPGKQVYISLEALARKSWNLPRVIKHDWYHW
jgi:hypothetical protein